MTPSPDFSCGWFVPDERHMGYELLTRYYGPLECPGAALTRGVNPNPAADNVVDLAF